MSTLTARLNPILMHKRLLGFVLAAVVLLGAGGGFFVYRTQHAAPPVRPTAKTATAQEIEDQWGIHVTQIGVTADGGMIDFRYRVIDPDKAFTMLQSLNSVPVLIAEDSGALINTASSMTKQHDLHAGIVYFILFHNDNGAIKSGRPVSVVIGNLRFEHVVVL